MSSRSLNARAYAMMATDGLETADAVQGSPFLLWSTSKVNISKPGPVSMSADDEGRADFEAVRMGFF